MRPKILKLLLHPSPAGGNSSFSAAPFQTKLSDGDGVRKGGGLLPRKELRRRRRAKTVRAVIQAAI